MAVALRDLAIGQFGCTEFLSIAEENVEIAISYWSTLESIQAWKSHPKHREAPELGQAKWYKSYQVQVVELVREYGRQ